MVVLREPTFKTNVYNPPLKNYKWLIVEFLQDLFSKKKSLSFLGDQSLRKGFCSRKNPNQQLVKYCQYKNASLTKNKNRKNYRNWKTELPNE